MIHYFPFHPRDIIFFFRSARAVLMVGYCDKKSRPDRRGKDIRTVHWKEEERFTFGRVYRRPRCVCALKFEEWWWGVCVYVNVYVLQWSTYVIS